MNLQNIFDIWYMEFAIWYIKLREKFATNEKDCKYLEEIFNLQRYFNTKIYALLYSTPEIQHRNISGWFQSI